MTKEDLGIAELTDLEKWITDRILALQAIIVHSHYHLKIM